VRRLPYGVALPLCLLLLAPVGLPAQAQGDGDASIRIQVERSALPELPDNVTARLSTDTGDAIGSVPITFWVSVEILGSRSAFLGTATTDATGVARVPITPRYPEYLIRAEFEGNDLYSPAEISSLLSFPVERVDPVEISAPASPLTTLRTVMPRVMGIVVAFLWLFFAAAVFYVVKTIHRHSTVSEPTVENR
jgi:hypothetical protein